MMKKFCFFVPFFLLAVLSISYFPFRRKAILHKEIKRYLCYYGKGKLDSLANFDLVIISPENYSPEEISFLSRRGTIVVGYISVGEDETLQLGDRKGPGGYASWYLDYFQGKGTGGKKGGDGKPDQNEEWGSYFVNLNNRLWLKHTLKKASFILDQDKCIKCGACYDICNLDAVEIT